jgi:hypothetical protein
MSKTVKKTGCFLGIAISGLIVVTAVYLAAQILILPQPSEVSTTLADMYAADQGIRFRGIENPVDIVKFTVSDWIRVNKTRRIVAADLLTTADDYANAAQILQHGSTADDYLQAQELSLTAYELGRVDMLRHSALAEDRYLITTGQPQKYGSQFVCEPDKGWQLQPIDSAITDEDRANVNIEPLSTMESKMDQLNEATNSQCSLSAETIQLIENIMEDTP